MIDVVLLNWIKVNQAFDSFLAEGQRLLSSGPSGASVTPEQGNHLVYTADGHRLRVDAQPAPVSLPPGPSHWVAGDAFLQPDWIVADLKPPYLIAKCRRNT